MARILGLIPSTEELPFHQQAYHAAWSFGPGTVPNNTSVAYAIGSYTMPFDGELHASFNVVYGWLVNWFQHVQVSMLTSAPGPNWSPILLQMARSTSTHLRGQLPMYARWDNLVKGQVVNLSLYFQVGNGGIEVGCEAVAGSVRAVRIGS